MKSICLSRFDGMRFAIDAPITPPGIEPISTNPTKRIVDVPELHLQSCRYCRQQQRMHNVGSHQYCRSITVKYEKQHQGHGSRAYRGNPHQHSDDKSDQRDAVVILFRSPCSEHGRSIEERRTSKEMTGMTIRRIAITIFRK